MKHGAKNTVAEDSIGAVKQKIKMQKLLSGKGGLSFGAGSPIGGEKATPFQIFRYAAILMVVGCCLMAAMWGLLEGLGDIIKLQEGVLFCSSQQRESRFGGETMVAFIEPDKPQCFGRRVYMYDLPSLFTTDVLDRLCNTSHSYCGMYVNDGLGPKMEYVTESWYRSEQYGLETVLHARFKRYECLINNPDVADLFYLPTYLGVDLSMSIFSDQVQIKDLLVERLLGWLLAQPQFVRLQGDKHVMGLGRPEWDFLRWKDEPGWGSTLLRAHEIYNVTKLSFERDPYGQSNTFAIPYPTSFHPKSEQELEQWLEIVSVARREHLVSYVGASRNNSLNPTLGVIRDIIFTQCKESDNCENLICAKGESHLTNCITNSHVITNLFLSSKFCIQPPGDTDTRKGSWDCLVAGAIPVFFKPGCFYQQYLWHLPADHSSYSVLIDQTEVISGNVSVMHVLEQIPEEKIVQMQAVIQNLIPSILYYHPDRDPNMKTRDAFDITVDHLFSLNATT